jgi:hypothetical protein
VPGAAYYYGPYYPQPAHRESVVAPADYQARTGFQIGARAGYAMGFGSLYSGLAMNDMSSGSVPLILDLGWRFLPQLYVGAYGQVAPVVMKNSATACPNGTDCSGLDWRLGIEADFHFLPTSRFDPYIGIGAGYEILQRTISGPVDVPLGTSTKSGILNESVTDQGWEMAAVTLGFDARMARSIGLGPFATAALSRFDLHHGSQNTVVDGGSIASGSVARVVHTTHETLIVGLRGTFTR